MAAFLFKVLTLTIRTASKPLANRFQAYILNHPTLRTPVVRMAQSLHKVEVAVSRGAEGKTSKAFVGEMTEERAMEAASKFVSESFVWAVAIVVLALEYRRQSQKDADKAEKELAFREELNLRFIRQDARMDAMERMADALRASAARVEDLERQRQLELDAAAESAQRRDPLRRSNSFFGMFSLSHGA